MSGNHTPNPGLPAIRTRDLGKRFIMDYRPSQGHLRDRIGAAMSSDTRKRSLEDRAKWALRHVDLEVQQGEIFGVVGRNGSGKTTLLSILARVTALTEGEAQVRGRVAPLLQVGAGFHPQLTGRDNIALSSAIQGMSPAEAEDRMDSIIDFSEVGDYIDQPVKNYSSGMYARLAYSVAAFLPAEIMLVDEILAVGDAAFSRKSEKHMRAALLDGRSVLYVGHALDVVRSLCTRALVLEEGEVQFQGSAEDAVAYYKEEIVARRLREQEAGSPGG